MLGISPSWKLVFTVNLLAASFIPQGAHQNLRHDIVFISIVIHESVVGKAVSSLQVLHEVSAPVIWVPPRHRGTNWANHLFRIHAVQSFAVFNQPFLIKVLLAAVRAREGEAIWEVPGVVEGLFSDSFHAFHDVVLVLGAGGRVAAHLGQVHFFIAAIASGFCRFDLLFQVQSSAPR